MNKFSSKHCVSKEEGDLEISKILSKIIQYKNKQLPVDLASFGQPISRKKKKNATTQ